MTWIQAQDLPSGLVSSKRKAQPKVKEREVLPSFLQHFQEHLGVARTEVQNPGNCYFASIKESGCGEGEGGTTKVPQLCYPTPGHHQGSATHSHNHSKPDSSSVKWE